MVKEFLNKYNILNNWKIIVACSWGSDSIFLLVQILKYKNPEDVIVWHFNHNLRDAESKRDEEFVEFICKRSSLVCVIWEANIAEFATNKKIWIEEAARIKRYEFLRSLKEKYGAKYILTAHHLDDKIETFMINLIRWTKLKWLISIEEQNNDLLRPLLNIFKSEILENLRKDRIDFITDSSNQNDNYLRNHLRLNILPLFEKINPHYGKSLDSLMAYFWEIKENFDLEIKNILNDKDYFEISAFNNLSDFMKKELIRYIFESTNSWTIWLTRSNIDEVIRFINDKWNYTKKDIKEMRLFKKNGKVYF